MNETMNPQTCRTQRLVNIFRSEQKIKRMVSYSACTATLGVLLGLLPTASMAQSTASGSSSTTCTQSGTTLTCTSSTIFALPPSATLQAGSGQSSFNLSTASAVQVCTGALTAVPSTVVANQTTTVSLTLTGCANGATFNWQSPTGISGTNPASDSVTLAPGATRTYSVSVCQNSSCNVYGTTVSATTANTVPPLISCSVTPGAPTVTQGGSVTLNATCGSGTIASYLWRKNGAVISGATGAQYTVPASDTAAVGSISYSVALSNSDGSSTASPSVNLTVNPTQVVSSCSSSIRPGNSFNYASNYVDLNGITLGGNGAVYVIAVNVGANDSSVGKSYLPTIGLTNSPVTPYSDRTASVSPCPGDFTSSDAQIVATGSFGFSFNLTTQRSRAGGDVAYVEPGKTYYINIRNDNCKRSEVCSVDGQYRNWNF